MVCGDGKRQLKTAGGLNHHTFRRVRLNTFYGVVDPLFIVTNGEEDIVWSDVDIELGLTGVDSDVNRIGVIVLHRLRFLMLVIRARGPHDYSS